MVRLTLTPTLLLPYTSFPIFGRNNNDVVQGCSSSSEELLPTKSLQRTSNKRRIKKQVRFNVDVEKNEEEQREFHSYKKTSKRRHKHLYWSKQEKKSFSRNARSDAALLVKSDSTRYMVHELENIFENCSKKDLSHEQQKQDLKRIFQWVKLDGARGIEDYMTDVFDIKQKRAVQRILCCQEYIRSAKPDNADIILRKCSEFASAPFREFAYKIALGDEFISSIII